jgi:alginate O-acetyltransferase complex protein AlgI
MLFNSLDFIFWFLPLTFLVWLLLRQWGKHQWAIGWLLFASLFFYSWWNLANLPVLLGSVGVNYWIGSTLTQWKASSKKKSLLILGIAINLATIGYFKYSHFLLENVNSIANTQFSIGQIVLPLGISFFTFQQIAYLVDAYRGEISQAYRFTDYALFVAFFPQLIAGPIVHHKDLIAQFKPKVLAPLKPENLAIGITFFAIGLFKKTVLADSIAVCANAIFEAAAAGESLSLVEAWAGSLAYSLQLYFDFSGYSDMAIGLGRMFGILLPLNFHSPYKATSVIDFWNRWHITLSRFLRHYLYIPLGGNRLGEVRRSINLLVTMLLAGLWHGAGWTFVFWGGLHGVYLVVNHQWRSVRQRIRHEHLNHPLLGETMAGGCLTFLAIVVGWVFFRADQMFTAFAMLNSMIGRNGISLPEDWSSLSWFRFGLLNQEKIQFNGWMPNVEIDLEGISDVEVSGSTWLQFILVLLLLVWLLPNTQEWLDADQPMPNAHKQDRKQDQNNPQRSEQTSDQTKVQTGRIFNRTLKRSKKMTHTLLQWQPNRFWAVVCAGITALALLNLTRVSQFLYFEF